MNESEFSQAYAEQNRRDYIASATLGTFVSIPLNLSCYFMDHFMYPHQAWLFFKARLGSVTVTALAWLWFRLPYGRAHPRFEIAWFMSPLVMILWMVYKTGADDQYSPYYAGLNIILLGMGLLSPWAYVQNLLTSIFVLVMYLIISFTMHHPLPISSIMNNTTFIMLTAVLVVCGSVASSRQRFREFSLRYELDKNRKSLEETNRKLVELDRLKSRFFANVSHELRTPLTLLIAPLETLLRKHARSLDAGSQEMLQTMHGNGMRLLKLINDLLDLIRLESGRLQVKNEPVSMPEFINGLVSAVRPVADKKRITLETQVGAAVGTVLTDRDKLEKIILNLLFNAVKFTPDNGSVWLRVDRRDEQMMITVKDTGMGIAEKNLPFVFDRFWQADGASNRKFQGVGIGLALVKELVDIQSGTASVQSEEGKGATFTVSLPYQKSETPAPVEAVDEMPASEADRPAESEEWLANLYRRAELFPAMSARQNAASVPSVNGRDYRPTVLVADDEPDMRRFLHSQLEDDYEVIEAMDGLMATEKAGHFLPDIILLDLMMPHKDGLQVCRELRENPATAGIPIILLTARADEEAKFDALQMGANDFLAKPFSSIELQARVRNLIERHHYQRRITKQNKDLTAAIEQIKETEMQLVQSEKLSSLGRLSAGIIHEINNPLNFTMTALFTLRNKAKHFPQEQRPEYEEILNDIEEGLKRVRNIVSDLRTFTHPGGGPGELVDTVEAANAALRFLSGEWKDRVTMEQKLPVGHVVWANRNKLIHVLVNLIQNSIDALTEKKFAPGEAPKITINGHTSADRSYIIIRDNGPGIDPQLMDKIFDPFFTTKEIGKGMGLGLSICYRIVHGYGGKITVQSEQGNYCMFTLDFPLQRPLDLESETTNG